VCASNPSFSLDASNNPNEKNKLILWQFHGNKNQQWKFVADGQGNFSILNGASGGTV
jgi:hypothetical protein